MNNPRFDMSPRISLAFLFGIAVLSAGCGGSDGPERHPVKGTLTYNGEIVQEGTVTLRNDDYQGGGRLDISGKFEVEEGLPVGSYMVYVTPPQIDVAPTFGMTGEDSPEPKEVLNIPQKYRLPGTTELEVSVESGSNDFKLDMTE